MSFLFHKNIIYLSWNEEKFADMLNWDTDFAIICTVPTGGVYLLSFCFALGLGLEF